MIKLRDVVEPPSLLIFKIQPDKNLSKPKQLYIVFSLEQEVELNDFHQSLPT